MCDMQPCPPCPPSPPPPCPQVCPPPCGPPICHPKPVMRGLHMAQTKSVVTQALLLSAFCGFTFWYFVKKTRYETYVDFYRKAELEEWCDDMGRKGLFQSVPKDAPKS